MRTFTYRTVVNWVDTDASGRIHNTSALRWAEAAEHSMMLSIDPRADVGPYPRRTVEATYHRSLTFGDAVEVTLAVVHLGRSSIGYEWSILSEGTLCIEGRHVVIHVGEDGRPTALPHTLREALEADG